MADVAVPGGATARDEPVGPDVRRRRVHLPHSRKARLGWSILIFFALLAVLGPSLAPYDPSQNTPNMLAHPSWSHWLGTTQNGQDVLSQLLVGTRPSLLVGFGAAAAATLIAIVVGIGSGYFSGLGGETLSGVTSIFLVLPALPLAIVLTGYLPSKGSIAVALVITLTGWAWGARSLRAQTLSLRRRDFITAARLAGEPAWRVIAFEILPNQTPIIASSFIFTVVYAIIMQASLAFLGLADITQWSWGVMLYWSQNFEAFSSGAWWWYVPPGLCIALIGTSLSLINFGIDEQINPRLRSITPPKQRANHRSRRTGPATEGAAAMAGTDLPLTSDNPERTRAS